MPSLDPMHRIMTAYAVRNERFREGPRSCLDPRHDPPSAQVFAPGWHVHRCPSCGRETVWLQPEITL